MQMTRHESNKTITIILVFGVKNPEKAKGRSLLESQKIISSKLHKDSYQATLLYCMEMTFVESVSVMQFGRMQSGLLPHDKMSRFAVTRPRTGSKLRKPGR
jgi:hypothetical protein